MTPRSTTHSLRYNDPTALLDAYGRDYSPVARRWLKRQAAKHVRRHADDWQADWQADEQRPVAWKRPITSDDRYFQPTWQQRLVWHFDPQGYESAA